MLNIVWIVFVLLGVAVGWWQWLQGDWGVFGRMLSALFDSAKTGFEVSIGLVGVMSLWLGVLKIGEQAGVMAWLARQLAPLFARIFPDIPPGHPAVGSISMNFSANVLGLDNAATPLGLQAMRELQTLNPKPDTASNPMIMFLVLNTAGITLIPTSVIAIRQSLAAQQGLTAFNGADIFLPTLMATFISFCAGLLVVAWVQRLPLWRGPVWWCLLGLAALMALLYGGLHSLPPERMAQAMGALGSGLVLSLVAGLVAAGAWRRIDVYGAFIEGAKEGFGVAVQIIPYLVAMLAAIALFRSSGCMAYLVDGIAALVRAVGLNTDFVPALPVGLMKTLSGSGARGLMVDVMTTHGVNSFAGRLAAIIQGSTETTFYVLAVYFGSVNIRHTRHALACGLFADAVGLVGAILVAYAFYH